MSTATENAEKPLNSIPVWLKENEKFFLPPVCNKLMHQKGQLKVFYVGGPNQREDFHLEEGEEFFYMRTGEMTLRIVEDNKFRDISIKEGECFLLPGRTLHSPQRLADTVGLVIERERVKDEELDCVRYFERIHHDPNRILYDRWFYCDDLGAQLGPLIKEFFASDENRHGVPNDDSFEKNPPFLADQRIRVIAPFCLKDWITRHFTELSAGSAIPLFCKSYQSEIIVYGKGKHEIAGNPRAEAWIWQFEGSSTVQIGDKTIPLALDSSYLAEKNASIQLENAENGIAIMIRMDPARKQQYFDSL